MITIQPGVLIGGGITIGNTYTPPPGPGGGTNITYNDMPGPLVPGNQLEDITATVNNPVGFTINNGETTGVAARNLSLNSQAYFATNGTGAYLVTFGEGSTYGTAMVEVVNISGAVVVFFINSNLMWPSTFNFPFNFSKFA